jgi:hypothetical protein
MLVSIFSYVTNELSLKFEKICCYSSFSTCNNFLCEFGILDRTNPCHLEIILLTSVNFYFWMWKPTNNIFEGFY